MKKFAKDYFKAHGMQKLTCCICGCSFFDYSGCNPDPIVDDDESVCCHDCDKRFVSPARDKLYHIETVYAHAPAAKSMAIEELQQELQEETSSDNMYTVEKYFNCPVDLFKNNVIDPLSNIAGHVDGETQETITNIINFLNYCITGHAYDECEAEEETTNEAE